MAYDEGASDSDAAVTDSRLRPPHRPSRRIEIIQAATRVMSRVTYSEATVDDVAAECGVAPTAIYYHFGGKEELFDQAYRACLEGFSSTLDHVRGSAQELDENVLRDVVSTAWTWWRTHPLEARFLMLHNGGATVNSRKFHEQWQQKHTQQAFDYTFMPARAARNANKAREQHAAKLLALSFTTRMANYSQIAWLDGPLSRLAVTRVQEALVELLVPVIGSTYDGE